MDQHATWYGGRPQPMPHCTRWGPSSPPPKKRGTAPQFSAHVYCGQTTGWIKIPLGMEEGLGSGHIVLDGNAAPPSKRGRAPTFRPMLIVAKRLDRPRCHVLGTKVDLGPGNIVLDADPAPTRPPWRHSPQFSAHVCCGETAGWIKMPLGTKGGLSPGQSVLHEDPALSTKRDRTPQCLARVYCGQTVAHLSYC